MHFQEAENIVFDDFVAHDLCRDPPVEGWAGWFLIDLGQSYHGEAASSLVVLESFIHITKLPLPQPG